VISLITHKLTKASIVNLYSEGILFPMARRPKNKFQEATIAFKKDTKFKRYEVESPFATKVTYKMQIGEHKNGSPIMGETSEIVEIPFTEREKIIKRIKELGYKIIKIEPATIPLSDLCPKCMQKGVPKIERKNNKDYRVKSQSYRARERKERPPYTYWLSYQHKTKPFKHWIKQIDTTPFPRFKANKKTDDIEIWRYYFPQVVGILKNHFQL